MILRTNVNYATQWKSNCVSQEFNGEWVYDRDYDLSEAIRLLIHNWVEPYEITLTKDAKMLPPLTMTIGEKQ